MKCLNDNSRKNRLIKKLKERNSQLTKEVYQWRCKYLTKKDTEDYFDSLDREEFYALRKQQQEFYDLKDNYIKLLASLKIKGVEIEINLNTEEL